MRCSGVERQRPQRKLSRQLRRLHARQKTRAPARASGQLQQLRARSEGCDASRAGWRRERSMSSVWPRVRRYVPASAHPSRHPRRPSAFRLPPASSPMASPQTMEVSMVKVVAAGVIRQCSSCSGPTQSWCAPSPSSASVTKIWSRPMPSCTSRWCASSLWLGRALSRHCRCLLRRSHFRPIDRIWWCHSRRRHRCHRRHHTCSHRHWRPSRYPSRRLHTHTCRFHSRQLRSRHLHRPRYLRSPRHLLRHLRSPRHLRSLRHLTSQCAHSCHP